MQTERLVRLFRIGKNQVLNIPRDFELEGDSAILSKRGDRLIVESVRKEPLLELLATLEPIEELFVDMGEPLLPLDDLEV